MADEMVVNGVVQDKVWRAAIEKTEKTGAETHKATMKIYANGAGVMVEEGEFVPEGVAVSDITMERVKPSERKAIAAAAEAADLKPKDVDLTKLNVSALQAMCAERGINVEQGGKSLTKNELIDAIHAARATDAG